MGWNAAWVICGDPNVRVPSTLAELASRIETACEQREMASKRKLRAAMRVVEAAYGLSFGEDWNKGHHAILHGYRRKLLEALADFHKEYPK